MRESPTNISYDDLYEVCVRYFDIPRQSGGSHAVFRTPWAGNPRVNIQRQKNGGAVKYQVRQVLEAIDRLDRMEPKEDA